MLRHLDLFSGIGGFALAAQWAGFTTVGFAEIDSYCAQVLKQHWPNVTNYGNVRDIEIYNCRNIDLLTGGFPCQPFSSAGKRKGTQDDRYLWPELLRIIRTIKPRWCALENVTGLVGMELDNILYDLEVAGYETETFIIPACAVQAPHRRERLWIVANSMRERCDRRLSVTEEREIHSKWERDVKAAQAKWAKLFPESWETFNFQSWLGFTTDPDRKQCNQESENQNAVTERPKRPQPIGTNRDACNTTHTTSGEGRGSKPYLNWQENEPRISGMDDGLSGGVDSDIPSPGVDGVVPNITARNKALGNAIVPQVIYPILRLIALMEKHHVNSR